MATNARINYDVMEQVAGALGALLDRVVFVGGAVVSLYVDDPAAMEARPTFDVDLALSIATAGELEELRTELVQLGFTQNAEDKVACRFRHGGIAVDVMALDPIGWAPGDRWYQLGYEHRLSVPLLSGVIIHVLSWPYFLASKFAAHDDRGADDPWGSKDLEDIVYVLDNKVDLSTALKGMEGDVGAYLSEHLSWLMDASQKEVVLGHLAFTGAEARYLRIRREVQTALVGL